MWLRQIDGKTASPQEVLQWGADPLWDTLVPVTVSMLHAATAEAAAGAAAGAERQPDRYRQDRPAQETVGAAVMMVGGNRAITRMRVLGDVILVKERDKHVEFTVDDGTGLLPCVLWRADLAKQGVTEHGLQLGKLVHVGGPVRRYLGKVQLTAWFLAPETQVDGMSLFWLQVIAAHPPIQHRYACKCASCGTDWCGDGSR